MLNFITYRKLNLYGLIISLFLLGFAAYLQYQDHLQPCPLCITQRFLFAFLALFFLIGSVHAMQRPQRYYFGALMFAIAVTGVVVAARQVWLQHLPTQYLPACGPGLGFMLKYLPPSEALKMIFLGTGECAAIQWQFLGMSIAEWSLIFFIGLGMLSFVQAVRRDIP